MIRRGTDPEAATQCHKFHSHMYAVADILEEAQLRRSEVFRNVTSSAADTVIDLGGSRSEITLSGSAFQKCTANPSGLCIVFSTIELPLTRRLVVLKVDKLGSCER
jgi:hypothetical protein